MALRLARAHTGKHKVVRFKGHFHGWHDHMTSGYISHFDGAPTVGVLPDLASQVILLPPGDEEAARAAFEADDDIAAAILEPTGGSFGLVPHAFEFLGFLRELTAKHGVVLIFDEVITGFRVAPGGAQGYFGVTPDMSTHAQDHRRWLAGRCRGGAQGDPRRSRLPRDQGERPREDLPSRHLQREPRLRRRRHGCAHHRAGFGRVREGVRLRRRASGKPECGAGGGRRALVLLRHLLRLPPLHEPARARDPARHLRPPRNRLRGAQGPARRRS